MPRILKEFIDRSTRNAIFVDFDRAMKVMKEKLPEREGNSGSAEIAWKLFELARDHFYMMLVIDRKLVEIAHGLVSADKNENMTVFMTLSRSFFEHAASLAYQNYVLQRTLEELPKQMGDEAINAELTARHDDLKKLFYSSKKDGSIVHINDMLKVVKKTQQHLAERYNDLCEFVHPNYGSNKLVAAGTLGEGKLMAAKALLDEERVKAFAILVECIVLVNDCTMAIGTNLIQLNSRINIASLPNTKPKQIFSNRQGSSGDGKSRETALTFDNARTHGEAIKAFYAYLEKNGLVMKSKEILDAGGGFLVDKVLTNKGPLFVKYKVQEL